MALRQFMPSILISFMVQFRYSLKQFTTISAVILILLIQLGSSGLLINKHFCKGELTEVSVLLANKGCTDDLSFIDRLTHSVHDCKKGMEDGGIRKAPCCDFESVFSKIFVYQDAIASFEIADISLTYQGSVEDGFLVHARRAFILPTGYRPPPDLEINICTKLCRFLI